LSYEDFAKDRTKVFSYISLFCQVLCAPFRFSLFPKVRRHVLYQKALTGMLNEWRASISNHRTTVYQFPFSSGSSSSLSFCLLPSCWYI